MKKLAPILSAAAVIAILLGGIIYQRTLFMSVPQDEFVVAPQSSLTGKVVSETALLAGKYSSTLIKNGNLPLTADGLDRDQKPLFDAGE